MSYEADDRVHPGTNARPDMEAEGARPESGLSVSGMVLDEEDHAILTHAKTEQHAYQDR